MAGAAARSELFGYERGAFTAHQSKAGQIELASTGVLFLDEVSEMSPAAQAKLHRFLQEREFQRLGGTRLLKADVRVIAASNRDLRLAVKENRFREDLYYRLQVFNIQIPALRDRTSDIPLLAAHFIAQVSKKLGTAAPPLTYEDGKRLQRYEWPGNIRELQNVIERAVMLSKGDRLRLDLALAGAPEPAPLKDDLIRDRPDAIVTDHEWRDRERANLMNALRRAEGRIYGSEAPLSCSASSRRPSHRVCVR